MPAMRTRRRVWGILKVVLAAAIVAGVGWHFFNILRRPQLWETPLAVRWHYLLPAALLYLAAHTCWGTFWVQLLRNQRQPVPWATGVRAYFLSQFGKYVPGKAWVIVIRVAMLERVGASRLLVALTATYETLTSMAAGALMGVALLPWAAEGETFVSGQTSLIAGVAALPIGLWLLNRLIVRIARQRRPPDAPPLRAVPVLLLFQGLMQACGAWLLLGLSLWLTVQAFTPEPTPLDLPTLLGCTATVALSYVVGFVVLVAPGGVGAREFVLQELLTRQLQPVLAGDAAAGLAVVVTLVLRLIWTAAELLLAAVLYPMRKAPAEAPAAVANREGVGHV
jgi:hypothetical protein